VAAPVLTRRALLAAGAAAMAPVAGWAAAGAPAWLAAARGSDGGWALHGLRDDGSSAFAVPLPDRGHAAAARPLVAEAVVFARRPGRYAIVVDCAAGAERVRLAPPPGRVFCGHGAFSPDGATLFTCESLEAYGEGRVGVWDAAGGWRRIGEIASGGVGPHEILASGDGGALVVANGGILTHPDSERVKLNVATMRPNLAWLGLSDGRVTDLVEAEPGLRLNSLRHLATRPDGLVAVAAQWEGDLREAPPLLALRRPGASGFDWIAAPPPLQRRTRGYAGSVALSLDGRHVAYTAPRGGLALVFGVDGALVGAVERADVCGLAPAPGGFALTDGAGGVALAAVGPAGLRAGSPLPHPCAWDNHLVLAPSA
jgi:hypothetical protein